MAEIEPELVSELSEEEINTSVAIQPTISSEELQDKQDRIEVLEE